MGFALGHKANKWQYWEEDPKLLLLNFIGFSRSFLLKAEPVYSEFIGNINI